MDNRDTKIALKQGNLLRSQRIECLKATVDSKCIRAEVRKRKLQVRQARKCSAHTMVWFVIAIWLFGDDNYTQVFRWLNRFSLNLMPSSSALTQARARLGIPIMAFVYRHAVRCLCERPVNDAFYADLRLVAVDGFVLNLADSLANRIAFGRPKNGNSFGAYPQVRIVALCEVGSRVFFSFLAKPIRCGEVTMAQGIYRDLPPDSLLLFDIGFCTYRLMSQVIDQGNGFLGRAKTNRCFKNMQLLTDGSYLSKIYGKDNDRLRDYDGLTVRVIEYTLDDPERAGHGERHRLVTTLIDEKLHPAETLIVLYHERWEQEIAIDETKTHLRHHATLRSHHPSGVIQEIYGMLIAHFILRKLAVEAACKAGVSPRRISFTGTIQVLRVNLLEAPSTRRTTGSWYETMLVEISFKLLEPRRNRINPRVIKRQQSKWPKKRQKHRKMRTLTRLFTESIKLLT